MTAKYYKDLREYLKELERVGKLVRVKKPINKDTQLHPLVRLQFRGLPEEERKAFLFENVFDSRGRQYSSPVAVCALAGSSDIYAIGMMCQVNEIAGKLANAEANPIPPRMVSRGPVHEEVHVGTGLLEHGGLDEFPVPISTPGYDVGPYITAPCWITKDPDTGIRNVGTYRAQIKSPDRTALCFTLRNQGGLYHWRKYCQRGIPMPAAIVIGGPPSVTYVGVSKLPVGMDEFTVAGGIAGEPLPLVKCQTVDLEVPAYAEVVIEGEVGIKEMEPEAPFGEAVGFVGLTEMMPYFTVKCITHRKNPIWLAIISQFPPSESSKIRQYVNEGTLYNLLRHELNMPFVKAVAFIDSVGASRMMVIQVSKTEPSEVWRCLEAAGQRLLHSKIIIAVDDDVNPWDTNAVLLSMCMRMQPHRDCRIVKHPAPGLTDRSVEPPKEAREKRDVRHLEVPEASRMLVNAARQWSYPPISLPKRPFMEEAIRIWQELGLPPLKLAEPWWGQNLDEWSEEDEAMAAAAVKGEYYKNSEIQAQRRKKI